MYCITGDELAAKAMGINVTKIKMIAFILSVALTSYSGCLYSFMCLMLIQVDLDGRRVRIGSLWYFSEE